MTPPLTLCVGRRGDTTMFRALLTRHDVGPRKAMPLSGARLAESGAKKPVLMPPPGEKRASASAPPLARELSGTRCGGTTETRSTDGVRAIPQYLGFSRD